MVTALYRSLRPHQWLKNLLLLVPLVTSHQIADATLVWDTLRLMAAFCLCASAVYLANDLHDVAADRAHPEKRLRPLASGALSARAARAAAALLAGAAVVVAVQLSVAALVALASYGALAVLYSAWLRRLLLVDVFVLSLLYTLRIVGGHVATGIPYSPWLLSFSIFVFLCLAFAKRASELQQLASNGGGNPAGRGYRPEDLLGIRIAGMVSGFAASLVLALYFNSENVLMLYRQPELLWLLLPLMLYWLTRFWMLTNRGETGEDPIWFAARDPVTWATAALAGLTIWAASRTWFDRVPFVR
jgi:4-hydroxybenzoate polyprenyltransferase